MSDNEIVKETTETNKNTDEKSGKKDKSNQLIEITKLLAPLLLGGLIGSAVAGLFQIQAEKERRQTELVLRVFEVSKYPQGNREAGKLDIDSFAKNMELLNSGKLLNPISLWWFLPKEMERQKPDIPAMIKTAEKLLETKWTKAAQYEALGFQALLSKDIDKAKIYFPKSYKAYQRYHNVEEINTLINKLTKNGRTINDWGKEVYCPILDKKTGYSWGMPDEIKVQMSQKGNCKK